jgi:hypothetical protein
MEEAWDGNAILQWRGPREGRRGARKKEEMGDAGREEEETGDIGHEKKKGAASAARKKGRRWPRGRRIG